MNVMRLPVRHMTVLMVAAALAATLAAAPAFADETSAREAERARQARTQRDLERSRDMQEDQHQEWMRGQRDIPRLITPNTPNLNVPIYTSPPRLQ